MEDWVIKLSTVQRNMVTQSRCTCVFFCFFFKLWNLEYNVDPSFPETSIHNEWLVNLMYASVESCSACSQPCLHLGWDHNEAIFLTDFSVCLSSDTFEPLAPLSAASSVVALAVYPRRGRDRLARPHHHWDNHMLLQLLMHREVFFFIPIILPKWHF